MPEKHETTPWKPGRLLKKLDRVWTNSARNSKGQLILRDHNFYEVNAVVTAQGGTDNTGSCPGAETWLVYGGPYPTNRAYASLMSKLRNGDASLGVTLASMNQSMSMIVNRFNDVNDIMGRALRLQNRGRTRVRGGSLAKRRASDVLEVEFGWKPFIDDIANSLKVIADSGVTVDRIKRVSGSAQFPIQFETTTAPGLEPRVTHSYSGKGHVKYNASYEVTNPNLWLANRLGLLNPIQVAWDRVPWSWVVNMFVNANQLIESVSDTFGLTIISGMETYSYSVLRESHEDWLKPPWQGYSYYSNTNIKHVTRNLRYDFKPQLEFRLPNFNAELGVIASALAVQRSSRL